MAKKVQIMSNPKQWQVVDGVEVLVDVPTEDLDPMTSSECVKIEGHRTLEETINQDNAFTPEITETKIMSKVGGEYHENVMDGAYEKAILYGNTQVNLVESVTTGSKYIPQTFTSFQSNEQKVSKYNSAVTNQVAPLVKGVTMVNMAQTNSVELETGDGLWVGNIKGGTKYTISFDFTVKNTYGGVMIQCYNDSTMVEISSQMGKLGDKVKYTFITHADANKIKIQNAKGYGGETIQLDNIMVIEGDLMDIEVPFFKGMRSVELVKPLTNLFTDDLRWGNQGTITYTNSGGNVTVSNTSIGTWSGITFYFDNKLKPNTKYLVMWDGLTQTQTSTSSSSIIAVYDIAGNINIGTANNKTECPTIRSILFDTTGRNHTNIGLRIHATLTNSETGTTTLKGLRVFEWDDSLRTLDLQTIGYFSGTKNVCQHVFKTESKNLYPYRDINFTNDYVGWCDAKGKTGMYGDIAQKSSTRFLLKKGTYTFSVGSTTNIDPIYLINDKEQQVSDLSAEHKTFTLTQDTYCTLRVKTLQANVATTVTNIQIERGDTATTYQEYNGRAYISDCNDEIILRSLPNGVCDTFNLQTGELVQRIGEIVLNETENWSIDNTASESTTNTNIFYTGRHEEFKPLPTNEREKGLLCDKFGVVANLYSTDVQGVMINSDPRAYIRLSKNTAPNVDSLTTYLKANPVTVQYELKEPIIKTLPITTQIYNTYTNTITSMGNNLGAFTYHYPNDFMIVGNLSPIPALVKPITLIPYNVRLKENTNYTLKYIRGNSSSMTFDLGGTSVTQSTSTGTNSVQEELLIKTPTSMLSHSQLRLSGSGYAHNFVIVEDDMRGKELPYFEGINNVKMPIVSNVSKNLFDINGAFELGYLSEGDGVVGLADRSTNFIRMNGGFSLKVISSYGGVVTPYIKVKPNTKYVFSADFIHVPASQNNFVFYDTNKKMISNTSLREVVLNRTLTTPSSCEYIRVGFWLYNLDTLHYENIQLEECSNSLSNTPYQQHRENQICIVQGEIPFTEDMFEPGNFTSDLDLEYEQTKVNNVSDRFRLKELIPVKPNTTYYFRTSKVDIAVFDYGANHKRLAWGQNMYRNVANTFTTASDCYYIAMNFVTNTTPDPTTIQLLELDSTIQLRSLPNGVKDELNLLTGEYIQRVGEKTIDGYEQLVIVPQVETGVYRYVNDFITNQVSTIGSIPETVVNNYQNENYNGFYYLTGDGISFIRYDMTLNEFYEHLKSNPITIQYELTEPIISYPRIVSNTEEREVGVKLPRGQVNTYNPSTGITTVRVGKMVLDGSENWTLDTTKTNTQVFHLAFSNIPNWKSENNLPNNNIVCDCLAVGTDGDVEKINSVQHYGIYIALLKTKASSIDQLKTYLASNPTTVYYELKYPQIQTDIVLPNGVHDEYNPITGVYTKKVGYVELDGSGDELWSPTLGSGGSGTHHYTSINIDGTISLEMKHLANDVEVYIMSDDFETVAKNNYNYDKEQLYVWAGRTLYCNILGTKLETKDMAGFRKYLSQNPIKVWYELQTPITYQLTPHFGLPTPYAYEDGHLIMESAYPDVTLPPEFSYKLIANRTGQIVSNNKKLQQHTSRLTNLEAIIVEATIESLFTREMQKFELELMSIQLVDLGE